MWHDGPFPFVEGLFISFFYLLLCGTSDLYCHVNWLRKCFDKAPPTSDVLNFLFLLLQSIVLIVHNLCRLLAITCKLAMELKQGTRSKGQTRREEGMYEGWKRRRVMFICHKEKIKVWDRLDNLLRNKERVERTGWWWFYTARIHIHCFFF